MANLDNSLMDIFNSKDGKVADATCVLARLWRLTVAGLVVELSVWELRFNAYIAACEDVIGKQKAHNQKGNLPKRLARPEMTFKVFCKGLSVLFKQFDFELSITKDGVTHTYCEKIDSIYDDSAGKYLKSIWNKFIVDWPDVTNNWPKYMADYKTRFKKEFGDDASNLASNLTRALETDELTWNVLYQGIQVHQIQEMKITVRTEIGSSKKQTMTLATIKLV